MIFTLNKDIKFLHQYGYDSWVVRMNKHWLEETYPFNVISEPREIMLMTTHCENTIGNQKNNNKNNRILQMCSRRNFGHPFCHPNGLGPEGNQGHHQKQLLHSYQANIGRLP